MASNVSAALGTQRKFSAQPENVYAQRLSSLPGHVSVSTPDNNDALLLAKSLGVLGNTIESYGVADEKNKEKIGVAEAEKILAGRSEEDMRKLSAVEMINNYNSNFQLADNPYAVITIEKMRGKYLGSKAKIAYDEEVIANEGYAKTAEEETARYDKFVRERYMKDLPVSSHSESFTNGFFDNHPVNMLELSHKQVKAKSEELTKIAIGSTQAALSSIAASGKTMSQEELNAAVGKTFAEARVSLDIPTRMEIAKSFLHGYAQETGDYEKIKGMADNVIIGTDKNGKQVKLGDVIPLDDVYKLAEVRTTQIYDERVQESLKQLQAGTPAEANALFAKWQQEDPHWFDVMVPYRDNVANFHAQREKKAQIEKTKAATKEYARKQSLSVLENQYLAFDSNLAKDAQGFMTAASYGDLPKFEYTIMDDEGNTKTKTYEWNKEDVNAYVDFKLQQIRASGLSPEQQAAKTMKLLTWPPASHYANSIKMVINNSLDSLTVDKMSKDENGVPQLTGQVREAVNMYQTDPEAFQHLFGSETTKNMDTLQSLATGTNDMGEAVALFALARDKRNDKEYFKERRDSVENHLSTTPISDFYGIDGKIVDIDVSMAANRSVYNRVRDVAINLALTGKTTQEAVSQATEQVRKNTYIYKDTAIPRSIFNGIMTENKAAVGKQVLDYYTQLFINKTGTDPAFVNTEYDVDRGVFLLFNGSGAYATYTVNNITYSGNYILQKMQDGSWDNGGQNMTLSEAQKYREERFPDMALSEGFYWGD